MFAAPGLAGWAVGFSWPKQETANDNKMAGAIAPFLKIIVFPFGLK
jgi:hypothetical protein